jgi:hypothetical protein
LQHSSALLQLTLGFQQQRQHTLLRTAAADAQLTHFEHDQNSAQQQLQALNNPSQPTAGVQARRCDCCQGLSNAAAQKPLNQTLAAAAAAYT